MPLSQDTLSKFKDFRRTKTGSILERGGQALGGGAETMRTGESAAATFGRRDPALKRERLRQQFMEKQGAKLGILQDLQAEEQFYFSREQEERMRVFEQISQNQRTLQQVEAQDRQRSASSATAAAQLGYRAISDEFDYKAREHQANTTGLTPATEAAVYRASSAAGFDKEGLKRLKDAEAAQALVNQVARRMDPKDFQETMLDTGMAIMDPVTGAVKANAESGQIQARVRTHYKEREDPEWHNVKADAQAEARQEVANSQLVSGASAEQVILANMDVLSQGDYTASQKYIAMNDLAADFNMPREMLIELAGVDPNTGESMYETIESQHKLDVETGDDELTQLNEDRKDIAKKTFGGDSEIVRGLEDISMAMEQARGMAQETSRAGPQGGEQDLSQGEGLYGLEGVSPAQTAAERMRQTFDLIEQYPDHPPLQTVRDQIMSSQEFSQFKDKMGYTDDTFAFREMNRMARQQQKDVRKSDKAQRALNMKQGMTGRAMRAARTDAPTTPLDKSPVAPKPKKHTPASAELVQGTASRVAEE